MFSGTCVCCLKKTVFYPGHIGCTHTVVNAHNYLCIHVYVHLKIQVKPTCNWDAVYIVLLLGVCHEPRHPAILYEFTENGSLYELLFEPRLKVE